MGGGSSFASRRLYQSWYSTRIRQFTGSSDSTKLNGATAAVLVTKTTIPLEALTSEIGKAWPSVVHKTILPLAGEGMQIQIKDVEDNHQGGGKLHKQA